MHIPAFRNSIAILVFDWSLTKSSESLSSVSVVLYSLIKIVNTPHTSIDRLLSDRIYNSKVYLMDDVQTIFSDCYPDEIYVMMEAANSVKKSLRVRKLKRMD